MQFVDFIVKLYYKTFFCFNIIAVKRYFLNQFLHTRILRL